MECEVCVGWSVMGGGDVMWVECDVMWVECDEMWVECEVWVGGV